MRNSREKIAKRKGLSWHEIIMALYMHWHKDVIQERLPFMGWSLFFCFKMSPGMRPRKDIGLINLYIENICYANVFDEG